MAILVPLYLFRSPKEEQMMLEHFGQDYYLDISRTGRIIPRIWR